MEIISRKDAIERGLKRYFTGKPCKNGHVSERKVSDCRCISCNQEKEKRRDRSTDEHRERRRVLRLLNRDKINLQKRISYNKNKSKINENRRASYLANRDKHVRNARSRYYSLNEEERKRRRAEYRKNNLLRIREHESRNANNRREERNEFYRNHYKKNRDLILKRKKRYYSENPEVIAKNRHKRRARILSALPSWSGEFDDFVWKEASDLVRRRKDATGIQWAADHMIPLSGRRACGLHVWNNCQVIPASLNLWKNNKLVLTSPCEWIAHL